MTRADGDADAAAEGAGAAVVPAAQPAAIVDAEASADPLGAVRSAGEGDGAGDGNGNGDSAAAFVADASNAAAPPDAGTTLHDGAGPGTVPSPEEAMMVIEAALICAPAPMGLSDLSTLFGGAFDAATLRQWLAALGERWRDRGVELATLAGGWRFQTRPSMRPYLDRLHPEKPPKYSRAVLETLAIVAYRQPVTRGDIEDIRGVAVSAHVLGQLEERGWVEKIGHRETPGRPALFATTRQFLDDLGIASLDALPELEAIGEAAQAALMADGSQPDLLVPAAQASAGAAGSDAPEPVAESSVSTSASTTAAPAGLAAAASTDVADGGASAPVENGDAGDGEDAAGDGVGGVAGLDDAGLHDAGLHDAVDAHDGAEGRDTAGAHAAPAGPAPWAAVEAPPSADPPPTDDRPRA